LKHYEIIITHGFFNVARGGEQTRGLSNSFIFSFSPLYRWATVAPHNYTCFRMLIIENKRSLKRFVRRLLKNCLCVIAHSFYFPSLDIIQSIIS
jgi:hypothetical protein